MNRLIAVWHFHGCLLVATREEFGSCRKARLIALSKENKGRLHFISGDRYPPIRL